MQEWEPPTDWYLAQFSKNGEWKDGIDVELIARVERLISTTVVAAIALELRANECPADGDVLGNLLQHWARIELSPERVESDGERRKRTRDSARSLAKAMERLNDQFSRYPADMSYQASRHVQHQFRVHYTRHLFDSLRGSLEELRPVVQALATERLPRGRREDVHVRMSVETLLEIFEYATGKSAGRTYDPIEGHEVSAFSQFVASAFSALRGDEAPETDWQVRVVLNERNERVAALRAHIQSPDQD